MAKNAPAKRLKVTLIKSTIGFNKTQAKTVEGMGLRRIRHTVEIKDTVENRGQIHKVRHLVSVEQATAGHLQSRGLQHGLGLVLVHRQGRGQNAGVRIGNPHGFQHPLDAAILAPGAVHAVQRHIGLDEP